MILFAIGNGLLTPALQSLVTKTVSPALRGAILGLLQSVMNLAVIFSTAVSGTLFALDPNLPNWLGALLYSLSLVPGMFLWLWARNNQVEAGAGEAVLIMIPTPNFLETGLTVGAAGFEPTTSPTRTVRATGLRHAPTIALTV